MKLHHALLALSLAAPLALLARPPATGGADNPVIASGPSADQATTARLVYGLLSDSRYAYRPRALDDALSQDVFKRYLDALDGSKMFFTADDVAKFAQYKTSLDDAIKSGELDPAYAMFALYKQRVDERSSYARNLLKQDIFDFSGNDRWQYDRDKAPWASASDLDKLWKQSVRNDWLRLKLAGKKPDEIRKTLDKRYANLAEGIAELDSTDAFSSFLNAYTAAIDPHTDYFDPRSAERFNQSMSLSLEGIGAQLQKQDDLVVIREVLPGGPAIRSGQLEAGDRIVAVGQGTGAMEDVVGWRLDDVVSKIKGPKGTQVRLDIVPPEAGIDSKPVRVALVRDKISSPRMPPRPSSSTSPRATACRPGASAWWSCPASTRTSRRAAATNATTPPPPATWPGCWRSSAPRRWTSWCWTCATTAAVRSTRRWNSPACSSTRAPWCRCANPAAACRSTPTTTPAWPGTGRLRCWSTAVRPRLRRSSPGRSRTTVAA
jgi:carboxyl-terminal processing protease